MMCLPGNSAYATIEMAREHLKPQPLAGLGSGSGARLHMTKTGISVQKLGSLCRSALSVILAVTSISGDGRGTCCSHGESDGEGMK